MDFLLSASNLAVMVGQFMLAIFILVGIHEAGHLLTALWFRMRVEKFSIGIPPKVFGFKYKGIKFILGAIPLGGFVKITGMIDESFDTEVLKSDPKPWEFRAKPAWQRAIVMLGGIVFNVILGVVIFVFLAFNRGDKYYPAEWASTYGVEPSILAEDMGIQRGDKLLNVNGREIERFSEAVGLDIFLSDRPFYTFERNDARVRIDVPSDILDKLGDENAGPFLGLLYPVMLDSVLEGMPADSAKLNKGDRILSINGKTIHTINFIETLQSLKDSSISIAVLKATGDTAISTLHITPEGKMGAIVNRPPPIRKDYTFAQAVSVGTSDAFGIITVQLLAFGKMFEGKMSVTKSLSGPIGIARSFGVEWNWARFWFLCGALSMVLAFMNLLPIPILDGGHVMFLIYEMLIGKAPSDKFLENANKIGFALLICLMIFAFGNDIVKAASGVMESITK